MGDGPAPDSHPWAKWVYLAAGLIFIGSILYYTWRQGKKD